MAESGEGGRRAGRGGLILVLLLTGLIVGGWSAWWWLAKSRLEQALAAFQPPGAVQAVGWRAVAIDGYPFRLRATFTDARAALPDGVGVAAPRLVAQAYAYSPTRWYAEAPAGLTLLRPVAGAVDVRGRVLRASAVDLTGRPRFAFEGRELTLTPGAGADPFLLDRVRELQIELVQGPATVDEAAMLVRLEGGTARPAGLLSYIGQGGQASLRWDALATRVSRLSGADWPTAARAWAAAGGVLQVREARLRAGPNSAETRGGALSLASDGRLQGRLDLTLRGGPLALSALGRAEPIDDAAADQAAAAAGAGEDASQVSRLTVAFREGVTIVGPVAIGPAPALF